MPLAEYRVGSVIVPPSGRNAPYTDAFWNQDNRVAAVSQNLWSCDYESGYLGVLHRWREELRTSAAEDVDSVSSDLRKSVLSLFGTTQATAGFLLLPEELPDNLSSERAKWARLIPAGYECFRVRSGVLKVLCRSIPIVEIAVQKEASLSELKKMIGRSKVDVQQIMKFIRAMEESILNMCASSHEGRSMLEFLKPSSSAKIKLVKIPIDQMNSNMLVHCLSLFEFCHERSSISMARSPKEMLRPGLIKSFPVKCGDRLILMPPGHEFSESELDHVQGKHPDDPLKCSEALMDKIKKWKRSNVVQLGASLMVIDVGEK